MAVTLAQSALLSTDQLRRGVIEFFRREVDLFELLNWEDVNGNSFKYSEETTLPGAAFRAVNAAYVESTGTLTQRTENLSILGGDADVDRFIVQTRGNLADQRATQTRLKIKAVKGGFHNAFINGDVAVDANAFDGLKKRLTGNQVVSTATNGLPVLGTSDTDRHAFLDSLDEALSRLDGPPVAIFANKAIRTKLRSAARRLQYWDRTTDAFGRNVDTYNGVALLDLGNDNAGAAIQPVTETQGTATDSSSIYAVAKADGENDVGVLGLWNGGIMVDDLGLLQSQPVYRTRIEVYPSIATFGRAAVRLQGVRNA